MSPDMVLGVEKSEPENSYQATVLGFGFFETNIIDIIGLRSKSAGVDFSHFCPPILSKFSKPLQGMVFKQSEE
jgi:hypothetical protein